MNEGDIIYFLHSDQIYFAKIIWVGQHAAGYGHLDNLGHSTGRISHLKKSIIGTFLYGS